MKVHSISMLLLAVLLGLLSGGSPESQAQAPSTTLYQQMTLTQRASFVTEKALEISRKISGNDFEFTTAFEMEIQKAVDMYARRIGNNAGDRLGKGDVRLVLERGQTVAPVLIR